MNNNLTAVEQEKLNTIVSRVLAVGVEGLTKKERKSRKELLTKKYPGKGKAEKNYLQRNIPVKTLYFKP